MKILILNASPRPNGNIAQMLETIRTEAINQGANVTMERVQQLSIRPCMACMKCRSTGNCVLPEDDAQRILALITDCDALVIGAPCYWGQHSRYAKDVVRPYCLRHDGRKQPCYSAGNAQRQEGNHCKFLQYDLAF